MNMATAKSKVAKQTPQQTFETIVQNTQDGFSKEDFDKLIDAYMQTDEATGDRMTDVWDLRDMLAEVGKYQKGSYKTSSGSWRFSN